MRFVSRRKLQETLRLRELRHQSPACATLLFAHFNDSPLSTISKCSEYSVFNSIDVIDVQTNNKKNVERRRIKTLLMRMCQNTWEDEITTKIYLVSELCCEFIEPLQRYLPTYTVTSCRREREIRRRIVFIKDKTKAPYVFY